MTLANACHPSGWDVVENVHEAPSDLPSLNNCIREHGQVKVWAGGSDNTIFADEEHNWAFRAWHDWVHWSFQLPFNVTGEAATVYVQANHLFRRFGTGERTVGWVARMLSEVIGQFMHNAQRGEFPEDQRRFSDEDTPRWTHLASRLAIYMQDEDYQDKEAIELAAVHFGRAAA
jgi:hypothetical protein